LFIYNIFLRDAKFRLLCLLRLIYNVAACVKIVSALRMQACLESCMPLVNAHVSDTLLKTAVKMFSRRRCRIFQWC